MSEDQSEKNGSAQPETARGKASRISRREVLRRGLQFSPILIPGVAEAVLAVACTEKKSEQLSDERKVITYPAESQPSVEIARSVLSFQKEKETIILFRLDPRLSDVIAEHAKKIVRAGYADAMDDQDFYHGHFHVNDPAVCRYTSDEVVQNSPWGSYGRYPQDNFPKGMGYDQWIDKFLRSDPYFVYHTREHTTGQKPEIDSQGGVTPPEKDYSGPPRSIIGVMDTEVYPMKNDQRSYIKYGSINGMDIFEFNGRESEGMCETQPVDVRIPVEGRTYGGSQMFFIFPDATGRYSLDNGMKFDVFLQLHY